MQNFPGRARRSEYWWVILAQTLISTAFSLINMVAGDSALGAVANVVISVYGLATLIPMISLQSADFMISRNPAGGIC